MKQTIYILGILSALCFGPQAIAGNDSTADVLQKVVQTYLRQYSENEQHQFSMHTRSSNAEASGQWTEFVITRTGNKTSIKNHLITIYSDAETTVMIFHDDQTVVLHPASEAAMPLPADNLSESIQSLLNQTAVTNATKEGLLTLHYNHKSGETIDVTIRFDPSSGELQQCSTREQGNDGQWQLQETRWENYTNTLSGPAFSGTAIEQVLVEGEKRAALTNYTIIDQRH